MKTTNPNTSENSKTHARALVRATLATRQAQAELDRAQAELAQAEEAARADGFCSAEILYRGHRYTVASGTTYSLKTIGTPEQLAEFARNNGLKVQAPSPETCSASTLRAAYARGLDVSSVATITQTQVYTVGTH